MTEIQYPEMRAEVVEAVRSLSDLEYQLRVWVRHELPHPDYYDEFAHQVHILYDDTVVFENPSATVGGILRNQEEVLALAPLKRALDELFDKYGTRLTDEEYIHKPEWTAVVDAARAALAVLSR